LLGNIFYILSIEKISQYYLNIEKSIKMLQSENGFQVSKEELNVIISNQLHCVIYQNYYRWVGWFMVFNATFNNISAISWQSVLLVEETGVPGKNYRPVVSH
jgi:hypothetical protein